MRMDENVSPEWMQQCQGSKSGRRALQEIERLTAADQQKALAVVLAQEWIAEKDARIEKLEAALAEVNDENG